MFDIFQTLNILKCLVFFLLLLLFSNTFLIMSLGGYLLSFSLSFASKEFLCLFIQTIPLLGVINNFILTNNIILLFNGDLWI